MVPYELLKFPVYNSRQAYRNATGDEADEFDMSRRPKKWADPAAAALDPDEYVDYEVLRWDGETPVFKRISMTALEAANVNLLPEPFVAGLPKEWEWPVRKLEPGESLKLTPFGVTLLKAGAQPEDPQAEILRLVRAIAAIWGVK